MTHFIRVRSSFIGNIETVYVIYLKEINKYIYIVHNYISRFFYWCCVPNANSICELIFSKKFHNFAHIAFWNQDLFQFPTDYTDAYCKSLILYTLNCICSTWETFTNFVASAYSQYIYICSICGFLKGEEGSKISKKVAT